MHTTHFAAGALLALLVAAAGAASAQAPTAASPPPSPPVSSDLHRAEAIQLVTDSLAACKTRGYPVTARVWDADGNERVVMSDDGAPVVGIGSSIRKATTVNTFKAATRALGERAKTDQAFADTAGKDPKYYFSPGGLPLYRDGKYVGLLAVGGGRDQDENCALDALKKAPWAKTAP